MRRFVPLERWTKLTVHTCTNSRVKNSFENLWNNANKNTQKFWFNSWTFRVEFHSVYWKTPKKLWLSEYFCKVLPYYHEGYCRIVLFLYLTCSAHILFNETTKERKNSRWRNSIKPQVWFKWRLILGY